MKKKLIAYGLFVAVCAAAVWFLTGRTRILEPLPPQGGNGVLAKEPGEDVPTGEPAPRRVSYPESYVEEVSDILRFDARILVPESFEGGIFYHTKGTYQEYDADGAYAFFFGDYGEGDVQARQWDMVDREGRQAPGVYYWRMPEDDSLSLYPTAATYTKQADFGYYALIFTNERASSSAYNADRYSRSAPLAFASREECAARILEALDALGYVPGATVQTAYALDAPALRREEEAFIESFGTEDVESQLKADWDTQDEAYVFYLWQECQGLPVWTAPLEPYSGLMEESEAPMQAILRRDGFVYFRVTDVLDLRIAEEYSALLPLGDIIQGVIRKYSNLISEQRIVVTDMRLCALTSKDGLGGCSLIPVWICTYEVEDDYAVGQMVFDAVTGYEIYAN